MVDGRTTDGQRTDDRSWLYYKLTNEPKGSGELIKVSVLIREKQQFENYHFQTFLRLSNLLHPISLNLNKFETDTPTEEKLT